MANTDIVTREDIGNGLAINANKLEADFTKVASKNDLLIKADLVNGKVPASQLPSFIDEIQEYPSIATFPITGQSDILYLALDTNKLYRWSGTAYVDLSALAGMPDFALNANVVHKTLDETIDGIKSFNSPIYAQDGVSLKNNNAPLLRTGRTILYANASQFGFLNGNDKGAIFMYNNANSLVYVLPSETGTLALLSDLAPYLTIVGAESTYQTLANLSGDLTASATKYPSVNAVNAGLATKFNNPTGNVSQYLRGDGSVANFPFIPTLIWGNIGGNLSDQTDLQSALDGKFNNPTGTTSDYIRGDGSISAFPTPYGLLPTGGEAGQILSKIDGTDYNATWIDNYALWTSVLRHEVKAGEALNKGQAVYISPIQDGTNMIVTKADYSQESTSSKTLGLVMQTLATNGFGQVVTEGLLGGLNTIGANQGDPVWLGASGNLIYGLANKPEAPNHLVFIGIVTRVNANNGEIFVKVQNGFELNEIHDVKILNKANNEVLAYEQSSGLWKNKAINDLIGYVPANDNNVLHLGGNETVSGNKTFTGATAIAGLFIDETFGYANIATHTQLKANANYFHFNASSNNKGAKFIYGTVGQRVYSLPITDGVLALTSDIPTLSGLGGVPTTRTITINGTTYDLSANRTWNLSATEIATALGYTPLATESDPIFTASPAGGITATLISNWNTAFGWGNHAGLYSLLGHTHTFASLTSKPTTLLGYGITDGATSAQGANADTAYSWGNHALAGYLLASTASTLYQSKDADLTAIAGLAGATGLLRKTALDTWALDTNAYLTGITSAQVTGALGYTPVPTTRTITINGTPYDLSADRAWTIASGVTSFNTRTGAITLISADVTGALGFTPYNASNPSGYISGITSGMVTTALGYTPYNSSNPAGYISGISSGMVTTALGYTPYNSSNPAGYITASSLSSYLPLSGGNLSGNLRLVSISGNDQIVENTYGAYLHLGGWAVGRTDATAILVNTAYRADYADSLFDMNISRFTNNSEYVTSSGSVNYASSAGNADTVDGYHGSNYIGYNGNVYYQVNTWLQMNGSHGMYWPSYYGLHVYANDGGSYGSLQISGSKNSWSGIYFNVSGNHLMMNGDQSGHYMSGYGWQYRWYQGQMYVSRSTYGGGTEYTVWDSGNLTNLNQLSNGPGYQTNGGQVNNLSTNYAGGQQLNPQVYFNSGIGLKVAMTASWGYWSDTMWVNGYGGGDVTWMCALHFQRNSQPRMAISAQTSGSTRYGTLYEVITAWNIADQTVSTANNLSGFNKTNPSFGQVYANDYFRAQGDCGLYSQSYGGYLRRSNGSSFGNWETFGYERNGWSGFCYVHNYLLNIMSNTSGDHGFYQENGNGWTLFYNRGNNCWGIGTDNTYSGDGFRCVKYGSSQYGWTTWSDRRAKENISSITGALDTVRNMRGVYFNYISDEAKNKRVGFIAQELELVLPEAVRYAEEIDEYNVEYAQIVSVLTEAIKEQDVKITAQEAKIQRLEQLVEQLINQ